MSLDNTIHKYRVHNNFTLKLIQKYDNIITNCESLAVLNSASVIFFYYKEIIRRNQLNNYKQTKLQEYNLKTKTTTDL